MSDERRFLTYEEALPLMAVRDGRVHTMMGGSGFLIGADWPIESVRQALDEGATLEVGGPTMRSLGHGLCMLNNGRVVGIAHDKAALDAFEPEAP